MKYKNENKISVSKVIRLVLSIILVEMLLPNDKDMKEICHSWNNSYGHILYIKID